MNSEQKQWRQERYAARRAPFSRRCRTVAMRRKVSPLLPTEGSYVSIGLTHRTRSSPYARLWARGSRHAAQRLGESCSRTCEKTKSKQILLKEWSSSFHAIHADGVSNRKKNRRTTRERGYALDRQEREGGLIGVATPVLAKGARIVAAVRIAGPTPRFPGQELSQKISLAKETLAGSRAASVT